MSPSLFTGIEYTSLILLNRPGTLILNLPLSFSIDPADTTLLFILIAFINSRAVKL